MSQALSIQHKQWTIREMKECFMLPIVLLTFGLVLALSPLNMVVLADGFTDIFYTNTFRGTFEWANKLSVLGMLAQAAISIFSILGVVLIVIRVMTSLTVISARSVWEEVHELKQSGGESELYDFGMVSMAKSWAKGKAGTGLDAIIGAALILAPDLWKYSDFNEKSGMSLESDISATQYMLKVALPVLMSVFFFSMGWNGTLWQALAVTVDGMGAIADKAISVNYAGIVDDLVNKNAGYKFAFDAMGTNKGKLQQAMAKDIYGRIISTIKNPSTAQLQELGRLVESEVGGSFQGWIESSSKNMAQSVATGLASSDAAMADKYYSYLGYDIIVNNASADAIGSSAGININEIVSQLPEGTIGQVEGAPDKFINIFIRQTNSFDGSYFNIEAVNR